MSLVSCSFMHIPFVKLLFAFSEEKERKSTYFLIDFMITLILSLKFCFKPVQQFYTLMDFISTERETLTNLSLCNQNQNQTTKQTKTKTKLN